MERVPNFIGGWTNLYDWNIIYVCYMYGCIVAVAAWLCVSKHDGYYTESTKGVFQSDPPGRELFRNVSVLTSNILRNIK